MVDDSPLLHLIPPSPPLHLQKTQVTRTSRSSTVCPIWDDACLGVVFAYGPSSFPLRLTYDPASSTFTLVDFETQDTTYLKFSALDITGAEVVEGGSNVGWGEWKNRDLKESAGLSSLNIYRYTTTKKNKKKRKPSHLSFLLHPTSPSPSTLIDTIHLMATSTASVRNFLVIINPFSGSKNANKVWGDTVESMFVKARIKSEAVWTTHPNHATEYIAACANLLKYDGVVAVGGDGVLSEILQGVRSRRDASTVLKRMSFGVVAAGSGNGLAKSICFENEEVHCARENAFLICRGNSFLHDLSTYETSDNKSYTAFLSLAWGLIADVDLESEVLRFLGPLRIEVYAIWRMLALRKYRGKLTYYNGDDAESGKLKSMPGLDEPLLEEDGWKVIEGDFFTLWACQTTHASYNVHSSPNSAPNDGKFQIILIRAPCSRLNLIKTLLAFERGGHINQQHVEIVECEGYRLEPEEDKGHLSLDGEEVTCGPVQAWVEKDGWFVFS